MTDDEPLIGGVVRDDIAPEEKPSENEPPKQDEPPKSEAPTQEPPTQQPTADFSEPTNKAFAHFRSENKRLSTTNEELSRKLAEAEGRLNGKAVIPQERYQEYLDFLALENPKAYEDERLRLVQEKATAEAISHFEARNPNPEPQHDEVKVAQELQAAVTQAAGTIDAQIGSMFPEVLTNGSPENEAFQSAVRDLVGKGSPAEMAERYASMVLENPRQFVQLAELVSLRHRAAQNTSTQSEAGRQGRVNQQGAVSTGKPSDAAASLTAEELAYCKDKGISPEKWASFNSGAKGAK